MNLRPIDCNMKLFFSLSRKQVELTDQDTCLLLLNKVLQGFVPPYYISASREENVMFAYSL